MKSPQFFSISSIALLLKVNMQVKGGDDEEQTRVRENRHGWREMMMMNNGMDGWSDDEAEQT